MKKVIVLVIGGTLLIIGVALLVLPGPAFVVIPLGLAVLATEFIWARRWLRKVHRTALKASGRRRRPAWLRPGYWRRRPREGNAPS